MQSIVAIIFKQQKSWSVLRLKFLHKIFYNSQLKKYNCNSMHSYNRKIWVDIPSYVISLWKNVELKFIKCFSRSTIGLLGHWLHVLTNLITSPEKFDNSVKHVAVLRKFEMWLGEDHRSLVYGIFAEFWAFK